MLWRQSCLPLPLALGTPGLAWLAQGSSSTRAQHRAPSVAAGTSGRGDLAPAWPQVPALCLPSDPTVGSNPLCPQHQWGAGSLPSPKKPKCWADLCGNGVGMLRVLLWEDEPSRACQHHPGPEERLQGVRAEQRGAQPRRSSCGELGSPGRPGFGARAPTLPAASRRRVGGRIETVMERVGRAMAWSLGEPPPHPARPAPGAAPSPPLLRPLHPAWPVRVPMPCLSPRLPSDRARPPQGALPLLLPPLSSHGCHLGACLSYPCTGVARSSHVGWELGLPRFHLRAEGHGALAGGSCRLPGCRDWGLRGGRSCHGAAHLSQRS